MKQTIGKAVKKPVEIHWFLYKGWSASHVKELMAWTQSFGKDFGDVFEFGATKGYLKVKTLEGSSYNVPDGYIIIRGVQGEFYPCDPEIFKQTYNII